jgi:hypothetical protein
MTDCEIVLNILMDGKWWNVIDIMTAGKPGSKNWAVRSRIADLRRKGYKIEGLRGANGCQDYRLVLAEEPPPPPVYEYKSMQGEFILQGA